MAGPKVRIVCATRVSAEAFKTETALGRSLAVGFADLPYLELALTPENRQGLPAVYNAALRKALRDPAILVFVHDDVMLFDYYWPEELFVGLQQFDIVGLVGNRRRLPRQPSACFKDEAWTQDDFGHMSGYVAYGPEIPGRVTRFGPVGLECKLLDGMFLAAHSEVLLRHGVWFDEDFDFHLYDLDFCRLAEAKGLRMGTVPISIQHMSAGALATPAWSANFDRYLAKWGE